MTEEVDGSGDGVEPRDAATIPRWPHNKEQSALSVESAWVGTLLSVEKPVKAAH